MFIGHFGVGFGAKAAAPRLSLGSLFVAAQFLDLLWPTLLLLGWETVRIAPGETAVTPLVFEHYPISHSLVAVLGWSLLMALAYKLIRRDNRGAVVLGLLVLSHWLLDLIVHEPDLPLAPGLALRVGFDLWASLPATLAVEIPLFAVGAALYLRSTRPLDGAGRRGAWGLIGFLLAVHAGNLFGAPPPNATAIAWLGQAQWLLVLWGYWLDRHRAPV